MRICVLQSAYPEDHELADHDGGADPAQFTDQHTFQYRWIQKDTAKEQIDAVVAEGFDFYFNFMWGQREDEVAGIEACRYFETFGLPSIGLRSKVLERTKNDFYQGARALGAPRVPGTSNYPFFVKPATSCASQFISDKSLCRNRDDLVECLKALNEALEPGRKVAGRSASSCSNIVDGISIPDDIVVQEYVQGWDHSVVVIEVGGCPVPLAPERYVYPKGFTPYKEFLQFDVKFHPETTIELVDRKENPEIFDMLQQTAVQAFHANQMAGQSWCNVDIRVPVSGDPFVLEVNPMPAVFLPSGNEWEDITVRSSFPGGHRALINVLIASYRIQQRAEADRQSMVANTYNTFSEKYDDSYFSNSTMPAIYDKLISLIDFSGTCLELGSGTGIFGRLLFEKKRLSPPLSPSSPEGSVSKQPNIESRSPTTSLTGIEISPGMIDYCRQTGVYTQVHEGSIQNILPSLDPVDHIISGGVLYFVNPEEFTLVMTRAFQLARKTVAVTIDEITEKYNERLTGGVSHMAGYNHQPEMEKTFCSPAPIGWTLANKWRQFGWSSPAAGCDIYVSAYVFERKTED